MSTPKLPNSFTITFNENYIPMLLQTVGAEETKKRLLEEGTVAFTNEIARVVDVLAKQLADEEKSKMN